MNSNKLDLSSPIFLQFNGKKFWEISLKGGNKTLIRYGKLVQATEVESTVKKVEKEHKNFDECKGYIQRTIETKKLKGYQGAIQQQSVPVVNVLKQSNNNQFVIKVNGVEEEEEEIEKKSDDVQQTDPSKECYLRLDKSWKASFVALTQNKKSIQEITGQIGLSSTWQSSSTELTTEDRAASYFKDQIENYENQGYVRNDDQYHSTIKEFQESQSGIGALSIPSAQNRRKNSYNKATDDSHSNYSNNSQKSNRSDLTDISKVSGVDLSFDADDDSQNNSKSGEGITQGSLGKPGKMEGGVLLAEQLPEGKDPTGWIGSEKMDGVRAIWTGSTFYSRNGNQFFPPNFFIKDFPKCQLDGELFTKRDDFQRCVAIVKNQNKKNDASLDERWKEITYLVYDAPNLNKPFKDRINALLTEIPKVASPYIKVLPHIPIQDRDHLEDQLEKTLAKGGEGIMLRDPDAFYEHRRSKTLLKVKVFVDEEAKVIGIEKGEGRCAGMMGAIQCRLKNGTEFKIGTGFDDSWRRKPPKIGSIVTFKYQNLSKEGKPRFPVFLRVKQGSDF